LKHGILLETNDKPVGGKWSFDGDNRKKYPKGKTLPAIQFPGSDQYWTEAIAYVEKYYPANPGLICNSPHYPYSLSASRQWLH